MAHRVITYTCCMGRWEPDAAERLQRAALELFSEQGFAETTVPQIAARAGLTTRTFFRHYADKREVLFAGEDRLPDIVERLLVDVPAEVDPMTLIRQGLRQVATDRFQQQFDYLLLRCAIIETDESLKERDLRKMALLSETIEHGLIGRGVEPFTARLIARLASTTFNISIYRWLDEGNTRPLADVVDDTLGAMRGVAAGLA